VIPGGGQKKVMKGLGVGKGEEGRVLGRMQVHDQQLACCLEYY
jgi:hypothetical protein